MKGILLFFLAACWTALAGAQKVSPQLRSGNKLYREGEFEKSVGDYDKGLAKDSGNNTLRYNKGNAQYKMGNQDGANSSYEEVIQSGRDPQLTEQSYYNKGVVYQKQQQLDASIDAWKKALLLNPDDREARENLQKALREKKQQQDQENQKKDQKKKQDQKQDKENRQPPPQQSKLNQQQVEQLLKALEQKEKEVQKRMQQKAAGSSQPEKDW
jgi:Ca-activated chloride channel family protein